MPRRFRSGSTQYLRTTTLPVTTTPLTISVWVRAYDVTNAHHPVCISDEALTAFGDAFYITLAGSLANDPYVATVAANGAFADALSGTYSYRTDEWLHVCGVFTSSTSREIWANGVLRGSNTTARTPSGLVALNVGRFIVDTTTYATVDIGPIAIYSAALTGTEILRLSRGEDPRGIQRDKLAAFWKMDAGGGNEVDVISGNVLSPTNAPGAVASPAGVWRFREDTRPRLYAVSRFRAAWAAASRARIHGAGMGV